MGRCAARGSGGGEEEEVIKAVEDQWIGGGKGDGTPERLCEVTEDGACRAQPERDPNGETVLATPWKPEEAPLIRADGEEAERGLEVCRGQHSAPWPGLGEGCDGLDQRHALDGKGVTVDVVNDTASVGLGKVEGDADGVGRLGASSEGGTETV